MQDKFTVNDLPLYNPWVKKLLGLEEFIPKIKNEKELEREYENEKWGVLLKKTEESEIACSIENVDSIAFDGNSETFSFYNDELLKSTYGELHKKYIELVYATVSPYLPAPAIVELGSGYGTVILNLAKYLKKDQSLIAAEFAASGVKIIRRIADFENFNLKAGSCNFYDLNLDDLNIPAGSIIFTSFATTCIPELPNTFLDALLATNPKLVIHFEALYEHCDDDLFGLLRKKYIMVNDYNKNLLTLVDNHPNITITERILPIIGINPLLCASILHWKRK